MRKLKFFLTVALVFCFAADAFGQDAAFKIFWTKFKSAVGKKDKNAVFNLSQLPIEMPTYQKSVRTKADFLRRYNHIFNGEADAAACFKNSPPQKISAKRYQVNCGFKNDPTGDGGEPIVYSFALTKSGWKFDSLDNINE
jgi:hypothetical protein